MLLHTYFLLFITCKMIDFCIINLANSDEVQTYYMIFVSISPILSSY